MKYYYADEKDESFVVYQDENGAYFPVFAEKYGTEPVICNENMKEVEGKKEVEALDKYMNPYGKGKKNIYMAGPLFNEGDRYSNQINSDALREAGYATFLPQEVVIDKDSSKLVKDACFYMDFKAINLCQIVVANCNGIEVDSGTAAEIGMCYALNKIIFAYKSDVRNYYNENYKLNNFVGGLVNNKTYSNIEDIIREIEGLE
jgi:nucleoside 2-deoxyribosyltransferase